MKKCSQNTFIFLQISLENIEFDLYLCHKNGNNKQIVNITN